MDYILEGKQVGLTSLKEDYIELYQKWVNDLEVSQFITAFSQVFNREAEEDWYHSTKDSADRSFTIHFLPEDKPIGNGSLHMVSQGNDRAELGIMIGEKEYWNKGLGTETVKLLTDFGFSVLSLHSLSLAVKEFNERAKRTYEKVGYKNAGRIRDFYKMNGKYYDEILMDILREEFYEKNESLIRDSYLTVSEDKNNRKD